MRPIVELIRLETSDEHGTFGVLKINKEVFCYTLEPYDRFNANNVASIPAQQYRCGIVRSPKYGETYEVFNVPFRNHILFHSGNVDDDTAGCILLGDTIGKLRDDERAVLNSGKTYQKFMTFMRRQDSDFILTIKEEY